MFVGDNSAVGWLRPALATGHPNPREELVSNLASNSTVAVTTKGKGGSEGTPRRLIDVHRIGQKLIPKTRRHPTAEAQDVVATVGGRPAGSEAPLIQTTAMIWDEAPME